MADTKENPKEAVELSQEEMATKRAEITAYYDDHIPHLESQLKYESLLKDLEKCRAERMQAQMFMTKMAATPPEPEMSEAGQAFNNARATTPPLAPEVKRTLKKSVKSE
jgi:hypothetical protein